MHTIAADRRVLSFLRNFYNVTGYDMFGRITSGIIENKRRGMPSTHPFWLGTPNPSDDARDRTVTGLYLIDGLDHAHWIDVTLFWDNPKLSHIVSLLAIYSFGDTHLKIGSVIKKFKTEKECVDALQKDEDRFKNCPFREDIYRPVIKYQIDDIPFLVLTLIMNDPQKMLQNMQAIDSRSFFCDYKVRKKKEPAASLSFFNVGYFGESIKIFACDSQEYPN